MNALTKAQQYVAEKKVFPLQKTQSHEIWGVDGNTGTWSVIYDSLRKTYKCQCKNIRNCQCSHILAVGMIKNGQTI